MVSIGALTYDILADTRDFEKGITLTRKEMRTATGIMRDAKSPMDAYAERVQTLGRLHKSGKISQSALNDEIRKAQGVLRKAQKEQSLFNRKLKDAKTFVSDNRVAFTAFGVALGTAMVAARKFAGAMSDAMTEIDEIAKTSRKLGLLENELITLRLAADRFAGMSAPQVDMAMQRMTRRIAEAAKGTGEAKGVIEE